MEKYIYKITNEINGKVYIGQTTDLKRRWREHCQEASKPSDKIKHSAIHLAMRHYGIKNFSIESLEKTSDFNEREKYWIEFYQSFNNRTCGYNLTPGGNEPPILSGEDSSLCLHSDEKVLLICEELKNTNKTYKEISDYFEVSLNYLTSINEGKARPQQNFSYPIRQQPNKRKNSLLIQSIFNDLINTTLSTESLAKKYNVDVNLIYTVNKGEHFFSNRDYSYPIREKGSKFSKTLIDSVITDLSGNELKLIQIEHKYGLSKGTVNRINQGKMYKRKNILYPIRNSKNRVRN